jgi:hypothetical protein
MAPIAFVLVIGGALVIGVACHFVGRAREGYEWEIGTVGALYGGLLANGIFATSVPPAQGYDGLSVIPAVLGGAFLGGLIVFMFRRFGSTIQPMHGEPTLAGVGTECCLVKLSYAPVLFEQPVIDGMRKQFGVDATVGRVEVSGDYGWIELQLVGVPAAVHAALRLAEHSGVTVATEMEEYTPALAA